MRKGNTLELKLDLNRHSMCLCIDTFHYNWFAVMKLSILVSHTHTSKLTLHTITRTQFHNCILIQSQFTFYNCD